MSRSFNRLQRVLELEAKQGYKNTAVVGGIRQFATFWVGQARAEAASAEAADEPIEAPSWSGKVSSWEICRTYDLRIR
jgi:hypothetical protein